MAPSLCGLLKVTAGCGDLITQAMSFEDRVCRPDEGEGTPASEKW